MYIWALPLIWIFCRQCVCVSDVFVEGAEAAGCWCRARLRWLACPGERVITSKGRVVRARQQSVEEGLNSHWEHLASPPPPISTHTSPISLHRKWQHVYAGSTSPRLPALALSLSHFPLHVLICIRWLQLRKTVLWLTTQGLVVLWMVVWFLRGVRSLMRWSIIVWWNSSLVSQYFLKDCKLLGRKMVHY